MLLYNFELLDKKLDQLGFPKIKVRRKFKPFRTNLRKAKEADKIEFRDDGIYLTYNGNKYKGYIYMPTYRVKFFGTLPRFHLRRCSKIDEHTDSNGNLNPHYQWSNHQTNDITDRDTDEVYLDKNLEYCGYCKEELLGVKDTQSFWDSLDKSEIEEGDIKVDIFGYVKGKEKISKGYREKQNYTCEKCSIKPKDNLDRRWWHVHHKDGDKINNDLSNLKCLCLLCHSNVDNRHKENFTKGAMPIQIESFKKEYREKLRKLNNPFI